jgi:NAD(P)-dependent dehydrogenase (short-subunit alcohol dehydrogenase family)
MAVRVEPHRASVACRPGGRKRDGLASTDRSRYARRMKIDGCVALVTGGASGLGEATVRRFVAAGAKAVILDRPGSAGEDLAGALGARVAFVPADVTSADEVSAAVARAVERFGTLHVAVNCAGVGAAMRTVTKQGPMPLEIFAKVIAINLTGTFNVVRLAAAQMARNAPNEEGERGVIVNTASAAAFDGQIGQAAYSASKGGVVAMTLPVARDLASLGIRVVTVAPGTFDTPMLAMLPEEQRSALAAQIPFPSRLGRPAEFAALVCHVVENAMLNGETIRLDGALRMPPR